MYISKNWFLNEFKQIGKDYANQSEVDVYESSHDKFLNIYQESIDLLNILNPSKEDKLVDFGCGTGILAIESAKVCNKVYAVDISKDYWKGMALSRMYNMLKPKGKLYIKVVLCKS